MAKADRKSGEVGITLKKLKRLEEFHRLQKYQQQQKLLRQMRDAQANADALEGYLAKMNYHNRSEMPDMRDRMKRFVEQTFRGRGVTGQTVVDTFPSSYRHLREVIKS